MCNPNKALRKLGQSSLKDDAPLTLDQILHRRRTLVNALASQSWGMTVLMGAAAVVLAGLTLSGMPALLGYAAMIGLTVVALNLVLLAVVWDRAAELRLLEEAGHDQVRQAAEKRPSYTRQVQEQGRPLTRLEAHHLARG